MRLTQKIARLLWPRQNCPVCGAPLEGKSLCPRCRGILAAYAACPRCACFTPLGRRPEHACPPGAETAAMLACFPYMAELRERLHRLKYHGKAEIAADFGPLLAERWREFAVNKITAAAIVPVPLHPARFAERGYNQSELLARALARERRPQTAPLFCGRAARQTYMFWPLRLTRRNNSRKNPCKMPEKVVLY